MGRIQMASMAKSLIPGNTGDAEPTLIWVNPASPPNNTLSTTMSFSKFISLNGAPQIALLIDASACTVALDMSLAGADDDDGSIGVAPTTATARYLAGIIPGTSGGGVLPWAVNLNAFQIRPGAKLWLPFGLCAHFFAIGIAAASLPAPADQVNITVEMQRLGSAGSDPRQGG